MGAFITYTCRYCGAAIDEEELLLGGKQHECTVEDLKDRVSDLLSKLGEDERTDGRPDLRLPRIE